MKKTNPRKKAMASKVGFLGEKGPQNTPAMKTAKIRAVKARISSSFVDQLVESV